MWYNLYMGGYLIFCSEESFFLYRISYIWYSMIGFLTTVIMGMIGSFATGHQNPKDVDVDLISPPAFNFYMSLSDRTKDWLNLPLKRNSNKEMPLKVTVNGEGKKDDDPQEVKRRKSVPA